MKKLTLDEAIHLVKNKKGAGKAKKTHIHLEMDIRFRSAPTSAITIFEFLKAIPPVVNQTDPSFPSYNRKDIYIKDKTYIETELEDNPDWPDYLR